VHGRVVGMMEFGWSQYDLAVAYDEFKADGMKILRFDPQSDEIGTTLASIIGFLRSTQT
jgi:hypothetical protein